MDLHEINEEVARQIDRWNPSHITLRRDVAVWLVGEVFRLRGELTGARNQLAAAKPAVHRK